VASLSQGRTAAAQCGLFTHKSVPVIFEPPCIYLLQHFACHANRITDMETGIDNLKLVYITRKYEVCNQYKISYLLKLLIVLNFKTGLVHRFLPLIDYTLFTLDILRHWWGGYLLHVDGRVSYI